MKKAFIPGLLILLLLTDFMVLSFATPPKFAAGKTAVPAAVDNDWDRTGSARSGATAGEAAAVIARDGTPAGDFIAADPIVGNLRYVPAGSFTQGSPAGEPCRDASEAQFTHALSRNLAVMETEVTRRMWAALKAAQPSLPDDPTNTGYGGGLEAPVQELTWYQAILFANLLSLQQGLGRCYYTDSSRAVPIDAGNYTAGAYFCDFTATGFRLPTEGEWEYFCRAGTATPFSVAEANYVAGTCQSCTAGDLSGLESVAYFCANRPGSYTNPIGLKLPNPWGLKDVHGNVYEWCWDWFDAYPATPQADYQGPLTGSNRLLRGGGWVNSAGALRSASRGYSGPGSHNANWGFRLVRAAAATPALSAPVLVSPANGAAGQGRTVTFLWQDTNGTPAESGYQLRLKAAGGGYFTCNFPPGATSFQVFLAGSTTYSWNVRAVGDGLGRWNSAWASGADWTLTTGTAGTGNAGELVAADPIVGNLRFAPAGMFTQGSPSGEACRAGGENQFQHALTRGIAVMETEVTRRMWAALKSAQPSLPDEPTNTPYGGGLEHPVQELTWHQAVLFANLLSLQQGLGRCYYTDSSRTVPIDATNYTAGGYFCDFTATGYRLPTEGEWECFCRAGTATPFSVAEANFDTGKCQSCTAGELPGLESVACFCANRYIYGSSPAGLKLPNPWGLKDVHGNVYEWCWDWYAPNPAGSLTDYTGSSYNGCRVLRGGGWNNSADALRSANRGYSAPDSHNANWGFRLVRTVAGAIPALNAPALVSPPNGAAGQGRMVTFQWQGANGSPPEVKHQLRFKAASGAYFYCEFPREAAAFQVLLAGNTAWSWNMRAVGDGAHAWSSPWANGGADWTFTTGNTGNGNAGELTAADSIAGNLRFVPAEACTQGSPSGEACRNGDENQFQHALTRNIAVMETAVTRRMWAALKAAQPGLPDEPTNTPYGSGLEHPVQNLTWYQAVLFANLLSLRQGLPRCYYTDSTRTVPIDAGNYEAGNYFCDFNATGYRLPTEGEWEHFCRAGTSTPFSVTEANYSSAACQSCTAGDLPSLETVAYFCADRPGWYTNPAGLKLPNPWNLKDVHGNVWEWCWDWYAPYPAGNLTDYAGAGFQDWKRVIRGGSSWDNPKDIRSARRNSYSPGSYTYSIGFRLVRTVTNAIPALGSPIPLSPANGATSLNRQVTFQWQDTNSSPQELNYQLRLKADSGAYFYCDLPRDATSFQILLAGSTAYSWSVRARGDGMSGWSSAWANGGADWTFSTGAGGSGNAGELVAADPIAGNLRLAPAGVFTQGSPAGEACRGGDENLFGHALTRGIAVMETTVTRRMWAALKAAQPSLPDEPTNTPYGSGLEHPVQNLTWYQAVLFANLLSLRQGLPRCYYTDSTRTVPIGAGNYEAGNYFCDFNATGYRLPTEGEWEYACRAGTTTPFSIAEPNYPSGDCGNCSAAGALPGLEAVAWFCADRPGWYTNPAGLKQPNPWNLKDVHGNAWEWCWDWYAPYPAGNLADYAGAGFQEWKRIIRGGSSWDSPRDIRSAKRGYYSPGSQTYSIGFRLVRTVTGAIPALNPPALVAPASGATGQARQVTFQWQDTNGNPQELKYQLRFKTTGGGYVFCDLPRGATSFQVLLAANTTYSWNVRAVGDGAAAWCSAWASSGNDWTLATSAAMNVTPGAIFAADTIVGNLRLVPAGFFIQGSPDGEPCREGNENQFQHTLTRSLAVMETEVTRQMWAALKTAQPSLPDEPTNPPYGGGPDNPVQNLSWYQAVLFANLLSRAQGLNPCYFTDPSRTAAIDAGNYTAASSPYCDFGVSGYRLPTEGEWEYACRAGTTTPFSVEEPNYPSGDCGNCSAAGALPSLESVAWFCADRPGWYTNPVGLKLPNPWNLRDVHGNVWEWCWDWYAANPAGILTDYTGSGYQSWTRVLRGGYVLDSPKNVRSAIRGADSPGAQNWAYGFRLVRTVPAAPCQAPFILVQPAGQVIAAGQAADLAVTAGGTGPLSYQWYQGASGNTTAPIAGATAAIYHTSAISQTASYWVKVTNACNSANSAAATVAIAVCQNPAITGQPQSRTIQSGHAGFLSVTASGTALLLYQWYQGASGDTAHPVAGAVGSSFTTPALTATTSYWVRVTNACNSVNSNTATLTVSDCQGPSIVTHPQSQTIASGQTAAFSVTASGTAPLTYQWYQGASPSTATPISGATASIYTTPALTATASYWVKVTNGCGSANSNTATVTICQSAGIGTHPQSQIINSGQTATLSVTATGTAPLSYQWYQGASPTTTNPITGATASAYTTPALTAATSYWVKVTNGCGFANSNTATVTICQPASITAHPLSQVINSGQTAALSVTATGTAPLAYQWYQGTSPSTTTPITGATASSYTTPALTATTSYWVKVTNGCGSANSNTATVTICQPAGIATHPQNQVINSGQTAALSVTASGTAPYSYQWYQGASPSTVTPIVGATAGIYTSPALTAAASYWVKVTNPCGFANSNTATVTICQPPNITTDPLGKTVTSGQTATLTVTASGTVPLSYQWYRGVSPSNIAPISGATATAYTTPALNSTTSYWVKVTNQCGFDDSGTATITVCHPAGISTEPRNRTINTGSTVTLSVTASGSAPLTYQWYKGASPSTTTPIAGATASGYTTPVLTATASYWVKVANECGFANSNTAVVTVNTLPTLAEAISYTYDPNGQLVKAEYKDKDVITWTYDEAGNITASRETPIFNTPGTFTVGGYLGVGTTSPERAIHIRGGNAVFRMDRSIDTAAFMIVRNDETAGILKTFVVGVNASGANTGSFVINDLGQALTGSGTTRLTIDNSGVAVFGKEVRAKGFVTSSSRLFKTNVRPVAGALDQVLRLQGVTFDWKDTGAPAVGLIAEDAERAAPGLAFRFGGSPAPSGAGIDTARLTALLLESVKSQQREIESLKQRRDRLQGMLDEWLRRKQDRGQGK